MLENLHQVAEEAKRRYENEFTVDDFILSDIFKTVLASSMRRDGQTIDYMNYTAVVTTTGALKMYVPNQWFYAATFTVEFVRLFLQYKNLLWEALSYEHPTADERIARIRQLKNIGRTAEIDSFRSRLLQSLPSLVPEDEVDGTAGLLTSFATDYRWWHGNKTIDRSDSYVSPVLSILDVVNASQGWIADISYRYATEPDLALAMPTTPLEDPNLQESTGDEGYSPSIPVRRLTGGRNEMVYGAPGTGKSRYVEDRYGRGGSNGNSSTSRVVFHSEYTYFDFVGTYKPVPVYRSTDRILTTLDGEEVDIGEPMIDYRFVPGPFTDCLVAAYLNPTQQYTLVIEEINRANAAAVFGDIFQLLDRDVNGTSEYSITPPNDLGEYLFSVDDMRGYIADGLRIPSNMNIVATMNSADQGVTPMDAAFKRRWNFTYMPIDISGAVHDQAIIRYAGHDVAWGNLVRAINSKLISLGMDEDRLIGPYFIKPSELQRADARNKLLLYLWDDVMRYNRDAFFSNQITNFAELSEGFENLDTFGLFTDPQSSILNPEDQGLPPLETDEEDNGV